MNPGKLLLVDFKQNKVIENNDLKGAIAGELPYKAFDNHKVDFELENLRILKIRNGKMRRYLNYNVSLHHERRDS